MEVTVIQKQANVSVMQAILEKGLYNVLSDYTKNMYYSSNGDSFYSLCTVN